jgi:hypothetical protein
MIAEFVPFRIPLSVFGIFYVKMIRRRNQAELDSKTPEIQELRNIFFEQLGSDHPDFFYQISVLSLFTGAGATTVSSFSLC